MSDLQGRSVPDALHMNEALQNIGTSRTGLMDAVHRSLMTHTFVLVCGLYSNQPRGLCRLQLYGPYSWETRTDMADGWKPVFRGLQQRILEEQNRRAPSRVSVGSRRGPHTAYAFLSSQRWWVYTENKTAKPVLWQRT